MRSKNGLSLEDVYAITRGMLLFLHCLVGGDEKFQAGLQHRLDVKKSREKALGKVFDLHKILKELGLIYKKYGYLSKQLLEKTARPNGELSLGTSTLTNQLRNRGMSLTQLFDMAKI